MSWRDKELGFHQINIPSIAKLDLTDHFFVSKSFNFSLKEVSFLLIVALYSYLTVQNILEKSFLISILLVVMNIFIALTLILKVWVSKRYNVFEFFLLLLGYFKSDIQYVSKVDPMEGRLKERYKNEFLEKNNILN